MKTTFWSRLTATLAALFTAFPLAPAQAENNSLPIVHRPLGLHVQLSTSAYKVVQPTAPDAGGGNAAFAPIPFPLPNARDAVTAAVALTNRSNSDVAFTFPDGASAAAKFEFILSDKAGNEVWRSDEGFGTAALTTQTLKRGQTWRRTIRVPLIVEGAPLPLGVYTLDAFTDADKEVAARSIFEVTAPPTVPAKGKINGTVVKVITPGGPNGDPAEVVEPVVNGWVIVQQLPNANQPPVNPPFYWTGKTDEQGKFSLEVRPGRYRVTAGERTNIIAVPMPQPVANGAVGDILPPPTYPPVSVEVAVAEGATVDVLIKLVRPVQPVAQGIKGLVVEPKVDGAVIREVPVAGVRVQVTELIDPAAMIARAPFQWTGMTNAEGRFEVKTPVGKFRVVATKLNNVPGGNVVEVQVAGVILPPQPGSSASAEVAVEAGKFSEVKLVLAPLNTDPPVGGPAGAL